MLENNRKTHALQPLRLAAQGSPAAALLLALSIGKAVRNDSYLDLFNPQVY